MRRRCSPPHLLPLLEELRGEGIAIRSVFLDANTDALVRRFSESRRPHPLSQQPASGDGQRALIDAIELERELLAELREVSTVVDTSQLRPAQLRAWMRDVVQARGAAPAGNTARCMPPRNSRAALRRAWWRWCATANWTLAIEPLPDSPTMIGELPLFPLQAVLFPGGLLSLKVFEARYLDLVGRCL